MIKPIYAAISAIGENGEIGRNNNLVFKNSEDMTYFRQVTIFKPVIMGYKTFESIGKKALDFRFNIVITNKIKEKFANKDGVVFVNNIETAKEIADFFCFLNSSDRVFIIGGASIYKQFMDDISELFITEVHQTFSDADTFFPKWNKDEWSEDSRVKRNGFDFVIYKKMR